MAVTAKSLIFYDFLMIDSKFSSDLNNALKLVILIYTSSTFPTIINSSYIINLIDELKSPNILAETIFGFKGFIILIWKLP